MKTRKLLLLSSLITAATIFSFVWSITPARAEETPLEQAEKRWEYRCQNIEKRIDFIITRFDNNKERHIRHYNRMRDRIQFIINRLTEKGYDTAKLKEDLQTFNDMIKDLAADYSSFINKLRETQDYVCGHSEGQFKAKLEEAMALLKIVHEDVLRIRHFYQTTIRADIKDLKN